MQFISYTGEKCLLRPLKKEDADISIKWRNDPEIRARVMGYPYPVSAEMEAKWYANALNPQNKDQLYFAIESLSTHNFIGIIMLRKIDWIARTAWLGITIGAIEEHHKGIGTEAVSLILEHAFNIFNLRKVCIEVAEYNTKSYKFWKKLNFKEEGCLKEQLYLNHQYHDLHIMTIYKTISDQ